MVAFVVRSHPIEALSDEFDLIAGLGARLHLHILLRSIDGLHLDFSSKHRLTYWGWYLPDRDVRSGEHIVTLPLKFWVLLHRYL